MFSKYLQQKPRTIRRGNSNSKTKTAGRIPLEPLSQPRSGGSTLATRSAGPAP